MARWKDANWNLGGNEKANNGPDRTEHVHFALLMDIRDELKQLNRLLGCQNFIRVPWELGEIRKAVQRRPRKVSRKKSV